jgi:hypothetical protein
MILELEPWEIRMYIVVLVIFIILLIIAIVGAIKENHRKLEAENPFAIKYDLGQVVYIFKDNRIYKDKIKEIKVNKQGKKYTGIILKDIDEKYIYATFDDLCNDNKLNKDDILMYAYNNDIDKKERRIEC